MTVRRASRLTTANRLMSPIYLLALSWLVVYKTAPIAGWAMDFAAPAAEPAARPASAPLEFSGQAVDGDLPTTYRLPPLPPLPAAAVADDDLPLFFPPLRSDVLPPASASTTMRSVLKANSSPWTPPTESTPAPQVTQSKPAGSPPDERLADSGAHHRLVSIEPIAPANPPPAPSNTQLAVQLLPAVQRGYELAQRGALFAARTEFVQVLRRVAQAKDIAADCDEHSQALAAGLRALDEADDFIPKGVQLEAELDVRATASSHRTPALPEGSAKVLPHEAVALYQEFAQQKLAAAVAGEQAGSMALYGLGRIDAQLAARQDDDVRLVRGAMSMYAAALAACPHNHLAANELGVLECRAGRPAEAVRLFERTIDFAPSATAYHNLAVAQQQLGLHAHAQANEQEAQRLAAWERANGTLSRRAGVQWVAPEELARVAQSAGLAPAPIQAVNAPPASKSPWQRTVELARSLPRPGSESDSEAAREAGPNARVVWPSMRPSQTRFR